MFQQKRVLVIEDEAYAAKNLIRKIKAIRPDWEVLNVCQSIQQGLEVLSGPLKPDIIFSDIELADGLSFKIFSELSLLIPVIFTTAYSQYALEAYNHKGFGYLLKPIDIDLLKEHILRLEHFESSLSDAKTVNLLIHQALEEQQSRTKSRFLIKKGERFYTLQSADIRLIVFDELSWAIDVNGHKHALDYSLQQLESLLDNRLFFRINRSMMIHRDNLIHANQHFNGRLKLNLDKAGTHEVFVSRERVLDFKHWMDS